MMILGQQPWLNQSVCDPTPSEMKYTHQVPCDAMEVKGEAEATWKKMR